MIITTIEEAIKIAKFLDGEYIGTGENLAHIICFDNLDKLIEYKNYLNLKITENIEQQISSFYSSNKYYKLYTHSEKLMKIIDRKEKFKTLLKN